MSLSLRWQWFAGRCALLRLVFGGCRFHPAIPVYSSRSSAKSTESHCGPERRQRYRILAERRCWGWRWVYRLDLTAAVSKVCGGSVNRLDAPLAYAVFACCCRLFRASTAHRACVAKAVFIKRTGQIVPADFSQIHHNVWRTYCFHESNASLRQANLHEFSRF